MAEAIDESIEQPLTPELFEQLAKDDIGKWLSIFVHNAIEQEEDEEREEDEYEGDSWFSVCPDEFREWGSDRTFMGLYIEEVDMEGGAHDGQDLEVIFAVCKGEEVIVNFRLTGYYSSYEGNEWNNSIELVEPREVLVTQWFATDGSDD